MSGALLSIKKIVFIGSGQMAAAIMKGLVAEGMHASAILGTDPYIERCKVVEETYGVKCIQDNVEAVNGADIIVLSVKPQVFGKVCEQLNGKIPKNAVLLSIMAGISANMISVGLSHLLVVRTIPNTPCQQRQGVNVWCALKSVSDLQKKQIRAVLRSLGIGIYVSDEKMIDAATGLSGSGPAFVLLFLESLVDAGVQVGFSFADAKKIALQLVGGTVAMATESTLHTSELRNQVTSPGGPVLFTNSCTGTTAAGLFQLEDHKMRSTVTKAVTAARDRSVELGALVQERFNAKL